MQLYFIRLYVQAEKVSHIFYPMKIFILLDVSILLMLIALLENRRTLLYITNT